MREKKKDKIYQLLKAKVLANEVDKMHRYIQTQFILKVPEIWGAHGSRTQILIKKQKLGAHGAW